jgi:hypothetical protein
VFFALNSREVLPIIDKYSFTKTYQGMVKPQELKIAIIDLGYVGLPLSLQFARSGVQAVWL